MKTLVIHPHDKSTLFLSEIYNDKNYTVSITNSDINYHLGSLSPLRQLIKDHDRIIMLGHGGASGLYNKYFNSIIDASHVHLLRDKILVGVWCYANDYFERYNLNGKYTGMIISELEEAKIMRVEATGEQIKFSNKLFAEAIKAGIDNDNFVESVLDVYINEDNNPVIEYNRKNIFQK